MFFNAVHIFTGFAVIQLPDSKIRKFKYTQNCTFKQIRENVYTQKYLCLQYANCQFEDGVHLQEDVFSPYCLTTHREADTASPMAKLNR